MGLGIGFFMLYNMVQRYESNRCTDIAHLKLKIKSRNSCNALWPEYQTTDKPKCFNKRFYILLNKRQTMTLIRELEHQGNWLFRYRGQIPLVLFLMALPVMLTSETHLSSGWLIGAIVASAAGTLIRAYVIATTPRGTSGRNTKEQIAETLNTSGIYSLVRHPLYLGNYLMWIGIVLFTGSITFTVVVSLLYWIYYERIMMAEERFLMGKFGAVYEEWASHTPAFIPMLTGFKKPTETFSIKSIFRREYSGWLATVVGFAYVDFLRCLYDASMNAGAAWQVFSGKWINILIGFGLLTLLLRSLKHYTKVLED